MECMKNGKTKFLFTKIPHFKEIILSSFLCEECGFKNSEVQFGGSLADFGIKCNLKVIDMFNMDRQIVKSEYATITIPELGLEIPACT
jgi:zinc finger protein